jgi:predicted patatin/cPLA2 family phospholipase
MIESKTKEFEDIRKELRKFDRLCWENKIYHANYERTFTKIAELSKAEEGCSIFDAKSAVAHWWITSNGKILNEKNVFHTCLACFPLEALRCMYLKNLKELKVNGVDLDD